MKIVEIALVAALLCTPVGAHAQLGAIGKRLLGGDGAASVATGDADAFLTNATRSTKNVMLSAALLAQAVTSRGDLAGRKAELVALQNAQDIKELDTHRASLTSDLATLNSRADLAGDLSAAYASGNAEHRKRMATALANLAIGIYRNTELVGQAPAMVRGVGGNPAMITRIGQFRLAASLLGMQGKGLAGIATNMPKLLSAMKVRAPATASTSDVSPISF